jgi:hypothetical protein
MAYRVKINNVQIEADTLAEVIELIKQASPIPLNSQPQLPLFEWNTHSVARFLNSISSQEKQLAVLHELKSAGPAGLLKEELTKALGTSGQQLGGVLSGIAKNAKKLNLSTVCEINHIVVKGSKTCRYTLRSDFEESWAQLEIDMANEATDFIRAAFKKP